MIKDALYAVTHGQDLSYDLAKDTMNKCCIARTAFLAELAGGFDEGLSVHIAQWFCFHTVFKCTEGNVQTS